jgi:hypothetical protein
MVVRNRRNTRFFWVMIVVLVVALYYAAVAGATVDRCGPGAREKWDWVPPPHWQCGIGSPH